MAGAPQLPKMTSAHLVRYLGTTRARFLFLTAMLCLVYSAACAGPLQSPARPQSGGSPAAVGEGGVAPDFSFMTFDGQRIALADYGGRGVVLNFWASWCVPCRAEMPYFDKVARKSDGRGVAFIGLALLDDEPASRAFLNEVGVSYPTGADPNNEIARSYQVVGLPTTVFIRPDGTVARKWPGPITEEQLQEFVRDIS
jgi:peroxiredoxin